MALALDASSPAIVSVGTGSATTASFTAPSGAVLVAFLGVDTNNGVYTATTVEDSGGLTWTQRAKFGIPDAGYQGPSEAVIYTAVTTSAAARTVTGRLTGSTLGCKWLKVQVWTGADTGSPVGATGSGGSTTNNITPTVLTTTVNNSRVMACAVDWNDSTAPTSTDTYAATFFSGGDWADIAGEAVHKAADTATSGTSVTLNFDAPGTAATNWNWCAIELKPAGGVTLTVAGLTQAQSLGAPTLTQAHTLAVAGLAQAQSLGAVTLQTAALSASQIAANIRLNWTF